MRRLLVNPFFIYIISFGLIILIYHLGWSRLYPELSISLLFFFGTSFIISLFLGLFFVGRLKFQTIRPSKRIVFVVILILISYAVEFIYNGGIPIFLFAKGADYDYRLFGIPVFHVLLVTFNGFYSVYIFHLLIIERSKKKVFYFLVSLLPSVLIVNRGMFVMTLTSCLFVYLLSIKRIRNLTFVWLTIVILIIFYFFGILGNFRQTFGVTTKSTYILEISEATDEFKDSLIPPEYIWAYLYISSPLANLQQGVDRIVDDRHEFSMFAVYELTPDFISKRLAMLFEWEESRPPLIAQWLNVGTVFSGALFYIGWLGPILMYLFFVVSTTTYLLVLRQSNQFYVTGIAILNTIVLYNTFDNMYSFTGLSFQLVYPLLFGAIRWPRIK